MKLPSSKMNYSKLQGEKHFIRSHALFVHYTIKFFIIFLFFIKFALEFNKIT